MLRLGMRLASLSIVLLAAAALAGCDALGGGGEPVPESGTYSGRITEVNAGAKEIYVDAGGQELELYFTEETELTRRGEPVDFSALESGQTVEVEVEKVGKRLDPVRVDIQD